MRATENAEAGLGRIKPEDVARKLAAIRNRENLPALRQIEERPRLVEMLWFLQAASCRPGGIGKFCEDMLAANPNLIGTRTMRSAKSRKYSIAEKEAINREIAIGQDGFDYAPSSLLTEEEARNIKPGNRAELAKTIREQTPEQLESICRDAAMRTIPKFLFELCIDRSTDFSTGDSYTQKSREWTRCFGDVIEAVFVMMVRAESEGKKQIAMTEVAKRVFQEMDYALQEKVMVRIEGESGFGKTESLEAWCNMRPGAGRLVRVPASNSMKDFIMAIGESLGIESSHGTNTTALRQKVEFILKHSGLTLVLDECAYLIPRSYVATSSPQRLEWVRDKIIDRGLPVVLASTPKKWESDRERFVKKTGYTLEEFVRRNFLTVSLPSALSESDMIAAAQIHFPQLDEDALGFIANEARLSQNYLQAVEAISKRARFLAKGRRISLSIIDQAIADVLPRKNQAQPKDSNPEKAISNRVKPPLKTLERQDFNARSLRGSVPESTEADLISADT